jgi:hypothetical protein
VSPLATVPRIPQRVSQPPAAGEDVQKAGLSITIDAAATIAQFDALIASLAAMGNKLPVTFEAWQQEDVRRKYPSVIVIGPNSVETTMPVRKAPRQPKRTRKPRKSKRPWGARRRAALRRKHQRALRQRIGELMKEAATKWR